LLPSTRRSPRLAKNLKISETQRAWASTEECEPEEKWKLHANCRENVDPELFFGHPDSKVPMSKRMVDEARGYCFSCPVQPDCLLYAISGQEAFGIWGGLTPEERGRARELTRSPRHMVTLLERGELLDLVVRL
jgi:WhiB family redox-sensing transcriptional regulator